MGKRKGTEGCGGRAWGSRSVQGRSGEEACLERGNGSSACRRDQGDPGPKICGQYCFLPTACLTEEFTIHLANQHANLSTWACVSWSSGCPAEREHRKSILSLSQGKASMEVGKEKVPVFPKHSTCEVPQCATVPDQPRGAGTATPILRSRKLGSGR